MRSALAVAALLGACWATTAQGGVLPDGGVTAAEVAAELRTKGFKAEVTTQAEGAPTIVSATDGTPYRIHFFGCNPAKRCATLMFSAGFDEDDGVPMAKVNAWNRTKRFIRAFVDEENDPYAVMDVDLERGATSEAVANAIDTWVGILPLFKQHFR